MISELRSSVIALTLAVVSTQADVVINEVFYNAPNEMEDLQWIEFYNSGQESADLSGWKLERGVVYAFPAGTKIAGHAYAVLARNADRFQEVYGFRPQGEFKEALSRSGMRLDLLDQQGQKVDSVRYKDEAPWPTGADGYSASLERICPSVDGSQPENWAASPLSIEMKPSGTPGKQNANFSPTLPLVIKGVKFSPVSPRPDQEVTVEAEVPGAEAGQVTVRYRSVGPGVEATEQSLTMTQGPERRFVATIPGQSAGRIIRFRIQAVDQKNAIRLFPGPNEPRPALSYYVREKFEPAKIPLAFIINVDPEEMNRLSRHMNAPIQNAPSEIDQDRMMARMQLESGLDLAPVWFETVTVQPVTDEQLPRVRGVFTNQLAVREKLISEVADAAEGKERLKRVPEVLKSFHADVLAALKPMLNEEQIRKVAETQDALVRGAGAGPMRFTPEMALKRFLDLEGLFFKLSTRAALRAAQLPEVTAVFRSAIAQRSALIPAVQSLMQGQGDFEDVREKVEKINEGVDTKLKSLLNPEQNREFARVRSEGDRFMPGQGRTKPPRDPQGKAAFVYVDPQSQEPELYDFVNVTERNSGLNIHFHKDRLFQQMSTANVLFEVNDRFVLAEPLAYELYRRAGNAAPKAGYMRLTLDGRQLGYYEFIEQPNRAFLKRNLLKDDGNLYKILWYERSVIGQHQKKTNRNTGHDDIVALIDELEKTRSNPDEQWAVIQKRFNVSQVVNYFAVNMCLSHWDGFFNNYFTYHDPKTGRWEMYPWDQDKTWGFYDGLPDGQVFYDMPLGFGMEGDRPPGWPKDRPVPRGFGMGSRWWRPGGYFSKPLLANPHFRQLFLDRTKAILESIYTEQVFFPIIEEVGQRLEDEVALRASILSEDPQRARARLAANLQSLKDHLTKRREFLLNQPEIRAPEKAAPTGQLQ